MYHFVWKRIHHLPLVDIFRIIIAFMEKLGGGLVFLDYRYGWVHLAIFHYLLQQPCQKKPRVLVKCMSTSYFLGYYMQTSSAKLKMCVLRFNIEYINKLKKRKDDISAPLCLNSTMIIQDSICSSWVFKMFDLISDLTYDLRVFSIYLWKIWSRKIPLFYSMNNWNKVIT